MASPSEIQSHVDAGLPAPRAQSPCAMSSAVVSDVPARGEEIGHGSRDLPKIYDLEWQKEGMPDTEFNRKYPPDAWGEEMAPNARVWKIYRDQYEVSHKGILEGWNKTLDVLLIFAGLFSAVLTAFLIESYKSLQPDYTQYVATFFYAAAVQHNRTGGVFPTLDAIVAPDRFIQTSTAQRWTNGLWFSSLVISLSVALLCILIKQWLEEYDAHVSCETASLKFWAQRHCLYNRGLKKWGVPGLISFLPLLLHLSLFLFFVGLILFLLPLDEKISYSLLAMVSCIATFYILSLVLPTWIVECPSYTPLVVQLLLTVSRAVSGLLYFLQLVKQRFLSRMHFALYHLAWLAERWLESIRVRTGPQLERETRTLSSCGDEIDGYVLRALIQLHTEADRDVANTTLTAIAAVTSTRTLGVISRGGIRNRFWEKFIDCFVNMPSTGTGFAITSHAQRCLAHQVMSIQNYPHWPLVTYTMDAPGFISHLGIDGLLLHALQVEQEVPEPPFNKYLLRSLRSLLVATGPSSRGLPLRSTCLVFLSYISSSQFLIDRYFPCFLLVFCAGRFGNADRHEILRALQSVGTVLRTKCSITIPAHNGVDRDFVLAVANGLWTMLADLRQYHIDTFTAEAIARETLACFNEMCVVASWDKLSGLSAFARSATFSHCVGTAESLDGYILLLFQMGFHDRLTVPLDDFWECVATLLKLHCGCLSPPIYTATTTTLLNLCPVDLSLSGTLSLLGKSGPYTTPDEWYKPLLSALLDGPNAIATWTGANSPDHGDDCMLALAGLASRISIVLCRRVRLGRPNDAFIQGFLCRPFLLARLRDLLPRDHISSEEDEVDTVKVVLWEHDELCREKVQVDLVKHCLKLSPAAFLDICTEMEGIGDAGSELRARAVTFVQGIRNDSMPGGALSAECSPDCPCMLECASPAPGRRTRWDSLVARIRPERHASMASPNV